MRKFTFSFKSLLVAFLLLGGANSAWAENLETIGAINKLTDYLGAQKRYTLSPEQTLSLTFTNYSGAENYKNWSLVILPKGNDFDDSDINQCYIRYRSDNYFDGPSTSNTFDWCNFNWTTFLADMDGAKVELTITRKGATIDAIANVTTAAATPVKYQQYYKTYRVEDGNQDIDVILTINKSYLVIDNDLTSITDNPASTALHDIIGKTDKSTGWWTFWSDYYTIAKGQTFKLKFKNYSKGEEGYHNWNFVLTNDKSRGEDDYLEYIVLRADNYGWAGEYATATKSADYYTELDADHALLDEATVDMTVEYTADGDVNISMKHTLKDGTSVRTKTCSFDGLTDNNIRVFLVPDHAYLEIYPETFEMNEYKWATFCSDYPLDLSRVYPSGLSAYKVTGHTGNTIDKTEVSLAPSNTPLLLNGAASTTYSIPVATSCSTVSENKLVAGTGAEVSAEEGKTKYVLGVNGSDQAEFQKIGGTDATVAKGKAYLQFDEVISLVKAFMIDGTATGVEAPVAAEAAVEDGVYYNLNGQQVTKDYKGIVIVNGKKFYNK